MVAQSFHALSANATPEMIKIAGNVRNSRYVRDWFFGEKNVVLEPIVSRDRKIFPPLHIKFGLMKQFVKVLDISGNCFLYITRVFHGLSSKKLKH